MITGDTPDTRARTGLVLTLLFLATFTLGCGEMLVVGILDLIATDLGVSSPAAVALVAAAMAAAAVPAAYATGRLRLPTPSTARIPDQKAEPVRAR